MLQLPARIGKYELTKFLGGGMSHVYRAQDTVLGRTVAIKILTEQGCQDQDAKNRFLAEAKMSSAISHDNIIRMHDYGEYDGKPYIVMEFLVGQDLRDAIRANQTGDLTNKLRIAIQIAKALDHCHSLKIIHRDIKPENVHLDGSGRARLMDFGIAKTEGLSMTKTGFALGTPYYMAPEQVLGQPATELVDIYAFGILLYELLTGQKPVMGDTVERLFYIILHEPLDMSKLKEAQIPEPLQNLIARATAKNPAERIQSFGQVVNELEQFVQQSTTGTVVQPLAPVEHPKNRTGLLVGIVSLLAFAGLGVAAYLVLQPGKQTVKTLAPTISTPTGEMILVPEGAFLFGENKDKKSTPAFYMDRTEVSNAAYEQFAKEAGLNLPANFPKDHPDWPVVNITFADAQDFAKWAHKRLPTDLEWEKAARSTDGRTYPWGNDVDASKANVQGNSAYGGATPAAVNSFQSAAGSLGILNMAGNVWEFVNKRQKPSDGAVKRFANLVTPAPDVNSAWYIIKGGSFDRPLAEAAAYEWLSVPAGYRESNIGFRCAKDALP